MGCVRVLASSLQEGVGQKRSKVEPYLYGSFAGKEWEGKIRLGQRNWAFLKPP